MRVRGLRVCGAAAVALACGSCELQEVTVVDFTDVAVAEVFVIVEEPFINNQARAFLHGATVRRDVAQG